MITTFSAIGRFLQRAATLSIIGVALAGLPACSSVKLSYSNGAQLSWWYLDGYLDFNSAQTPSVKQGLQELFAWHRSTQLGDYAGLLVQAQQAVTEPTTAAATCRWWQLVQDKLDPSIERAVVHAAQVVPLLGDAQFKHMEVKYAKVLDEMRSDYMQPDAEDRLAASVKRAMTRAEQLYGSLDEPQRKVVVAGVAASPFDPQAWMQERQRRQRETLQTLRRLVAERPGTDQRVAALRRLVEHTERSPDPAYRAYQQRLQDYNCVFAAQIHNATTAAQRQKARQRLKGWEDDFRSLAAATAPS
jgi:hypothetical protein